MLHRNNEFNTKLAKMLRRSVAYHMSCHLRPIVPQKPTLKFMQMLDLDVDLTYKGWRIGIWKKHLEWFVSSRRSWREGWAP